MTDTYFLPYQQAWIKDESQKKICEKSRRVGITHAQAYEDVKDCVVGNEDRVYFSSADESAAKEYIDDCATFAQVFNIGAQKMGEVILDREKDVKALRIDLMNGARLHAMTSNPKRFRSKGGKAILDEFAFHNDPQELWKAAKALGVWGHKIRIISTHNSVASFYNQNFLEKIKKGELTSWSHHKIDIYKALAQGLLDKIKGRPTTEEEQQEWLDDLKEDMTEEDFLEEFGCIPQSGKSAFLSYEMLAEVESENVMWGDINDDTIPANTSGLLYLGKDIGRRKDLTVKWLSELIGGMLFTRMILVEEHLKFRLQRQSLYNILRHPLLRRACIDETGIGMQLAEEAQEDFGKMRVEPVSFTNSMKETLAWDLRNRIENKTMLIPAHKDIRQDLHSIKKSVTAAGNVRFAQNAMSKKNTDGHADRFWAAALSCHAAKSYSGEVNVASKGRRKSNDMMRGYR